MVANIARVDLRAAYAVAAEIAETAVDCRRWACQLNYTQNLLALKLWYMKFTARCRMYGARHDDDVKVKTGMRLT